MRGVSTNIFSLPIDASWKLPLDALLYVFPSLLLSNSYLKEGDFRVSDIEVISRYILVYRSVVRPFFFLIENSVRAPSS